MASEQGTESKATMPWSEEVQSNASGSDYSLHAEHIQALEAPDYNNEQDMEYIQSRMRSTVLFEALQEPAFENQEGIDYIHPRLRSTVFPQTREYGNQLKYENQQEIEYIQPRLRSTLFSKELQAPKYDNQQGMEYVRTIRRSTKSFEAVHLQATECENQQGIEHIRPMIRSTKSFEAVHLQATEYENQQGIEYIQTAIRSAKSFEELKAPKSENKQECEEIQAKKKSTEDEIINKHGQGTILDTDLLSLDTDLLYFVQRLLEAVKYENELCDAYESEFRLNNGPKLYKFAKYYGFDKIEPVFRKETLKTRRNGLYSLLQPESKQLALKIYYAYFTYLQASRGCFIKIASGYLWEYLLKTSLHLREPQAKDEIIDAYNSWASMTIPVNEVYEKQFLNKLLKLINAKNTMHIGVYTGYSLLATAQALPDHGKILAFDIGRESDENGLPGVGHKIDITEALHVLDHMLEDGKYHGTFDFIYVDDDKDNYINYHKRLIDLVKFGGLIAYDNTLWSATGPADAPLKYYKDLIEHNKALAVDPKIKICLFPFGEGVTLCGRIS